jgi:multisubunit Na+/H+ antiporter MnhE subunit
MKSLDSAKKIEVTLEFLIFGIVIGVIEDIVAVKVTTGASITWETVGIIVLIAIPFAVLGEIFADNIDFAKYIRRFRSEDNNSPENLNRSAKS